MTVSIRRDIRELDATEWDGLFGVRGLYSTTPWLRHAQATAEVAPYYVTLGDGDALVAALVAYPLDDTTPYLFCNPARVVDTVHRAVTDESAPWAVDLVPGLVCGGRNPAHARIGVVPGLGGDRRRAAVRELVRAAEARAREAGLRSVSFLAVDEDDELLRSVLSEERFTYLAGSPAYSLNVPSGGSFQSYLAGFDQRRRGKIKREIRALEEAGVRYRAQQLTHELIEQIAPLEVALYARYGTAADAKAFVRVLRSIGTHAAEVTRVVTAEIDSQPAAFVLCFTHSDELYARQAGFDYERQGRLPLYFGLVYYELIRTAIAEGLHTIHYGTGSDAAKRSRGCVGRRQFVYVKSFETHPAERLGELAARQRSGSEEPL